MASEASTIATSGTNSTSDTNTKTEESKVSSTVTKSGRTCSSPNCNKPASLKCPSCIKLGLPDSFFCDQECFRQSWRLHNRVHIRHQEHLERIEGLKRYKVPEFGYTGSLRPSYITPMKSVPDTIDKPDYAVDGVPISEARFHRTSPNKIPIYTPKDIEGIRLACKLGREVLDIAGRLVRPGITTDEIDVAVHEACIERGCYPSPLNYNGFLKSCCTSVNEVVCHGIPDCRPLEDGDIVNIDISVYKDGYHGDLNETFTVGNVDPKSKNLIKVTHDSLVEAIKHVKPGVMFRKFGEVIDNYVSKHGYTPNRTYCGHGIGMLFHCPPNIPHYKKNKAAGKAKPGMVFTIEPMINMGQWKDKLWTFDHWTDVTADGQRSAQFEHTLLVTEDGCEVLTARTSDSPPLWWELEPAPLSTTTATTSTEEKSMVVDEPNSEKQQNNPPSSETNTDHNSTVENGTKTTPSSQENTSNEQMQTDSDKSNKKANKKQKKKKGGNVK